MTKSELKTGMIVTLADGKEYMVFKNAIHGFSNAADVIVATDGSTSWMDLNNYNEDMTQHSYGDLNIVKVAQVDHPYAFIRPEYKRECRKVLWSKKKCYTYAQLRKILGEEFEVVG